MLGGRAVLIKSKYVFQTKKFALLGFVALYTLEVPEADECCGKTRVICHAYRV